MNAFLAILLIAAAHVILFTCTTWVGGWRRLQRRYPASIELPTRGLDISFLYLGLPFLPAWARVGAGKQGLYLEPVFPATLFFEAILLPWNQFTFSCDTFIGWKFAKIEPREAPNSVVYLFDDYFRELQSRFAPPEATERASSQDGEQPKGRR